MPSFPVSQALHLGRHERVAMLVKEVGGLGRAAELANVNTDTVNRWRKPGAKLPIDGLFELCVEAKVSLDWVATGYMVRPDLQAQLGGLDEFAAGSPPGPGFEQLMPLKPRVVQRGGSAVELFAPSEISVSAQWLKREFNLPAEGARYAIVEDDGMAPRVGRGAFVLVEAARPAQYKSGVYLVEGDELLARRLYRMPDGNFELTADADSNWRFRSELAGLPSLHRIVWAGQKL